MERLIDLFDRFRCWRKLKRDSMVVWWMPQLAGVLFFHYKQEKRERNEMSYRTLQNHQLWSTLFTLKEYVPSFRHTSASAPIKPTTYSQPTDNYKSQFKLILSILNMSSRFQLSTYWLPINNHNKTWYAPLKQARHQRKGSCRSQKLWIYRI